MKYWLFFLIFIGLCSCSEQDSTVSSFNRIEIQGRDNGNLKRSFIYRAKVPKDWIVKLPVPEDSIADTTKAIADFFIVQEDQKIRIAVHNFPTQSMEERVPPVAQISRWKRQFQELDPTSIFMIPQAFGGFHGLLFEGTGDMKGERVSILGWSLQIASQHYQALSRSSDQNLAAKFRQMRADVTIKAVGPENLMQKKRDEIVTFARSFQLIDDIP